jgi:PAS domain S-box-containing protein
MLRSLQWSSFRLRTQSLIVVALSVLPLAWFWLLIGITYIQQDTPTDSSTRSLSVQAGLARVFIALLDADAGARDHLLTDNATALSRYHDAVGRLPTPLAELSTSLVEPDLRESLAALNATVDDELMVLKRLTEGQSPTAPPLGERAALDRSEANLNRLRTLATSIEQQQIALTRETETLHYQAERTLFLIFLVGSVVCVGAGVTAALVKSNGLSRRIAVLARNADRLARGEAGEAFPMGGDEIAQLDARFRDASRLLRQREDELRRSSQLLDAFFNNLSYDLFCIAGFDGYFRRLNPAWASTLGFTTDELLATPLLDLVHLDDRPRMAAAFESIAQGHGGVALDSRLRCKDGSYRWLRWNARPRDTEELIDASARDVTHQRELNATLHRRTSELEAANSELEAFSYSVSHDLRAPLRAIDGFSQTIEEDYADRLDAHGRDALTRVRGAARRMGTLIDELLNLSQVTRLELRREPIDLGAEASIILGELARSRPDRQVDVRIEPGLTIAADPQMVQIALENLLGNAWKYTGKTPRPWIEIGSTPNGSARVFHIRDNGAGFDMAYVDKLFGAFQRLHSHQDFEGTGIGLAVVQRIVHRHGGKIWADAAVDAGATFYFTLQPEDAERS